MGVFSATSVTYKIIMKKPVRISIPTPCHENWQDMKPVERGRFCDSCQKKVHDFTASPDKVILEAFAKDSRLCGRFRVDQLDRELIIPKEKSTIWTAVSAAVISFLALGNYPASAQEPVSTEQHENENYALGKYAAAPQKMIVSGVVSDEGGPLPGANITITGKESQVSADIDGFYQIEVIPGEVLEFQFAGYDTQRITVSVNNSINVILSYDARPTQTGSYGYIKINPVPQQTNTTDCMTENRTFFGRIFQRIGNLFK